MKRRHLFEFHDQRWFPAALRGDLRLLLQYQIIRYDFYAPIIPLLADALRQNGVRRLIDFGSGEGKVAQYIQERLAASGCQVDLLLTDLYPPSTPIDQPRVTYHAVPVDARRLPPLPVGMWTFFTSFHHFKPDEAVSILREAVAAKMPTGIFEFTERTRGNLFGTMLSPLAVWLDTLQLEQGGLRQVRMMTLLPCFYGWDAFVSHLRTYTLGELQALTDAATAPDYRWNSGKVSGEIGNVTYLIGSPYPDAALPKPY